VLGIVLTGMGARGLKSMRDNIKGLADELAGLASQYRMGA
jgi:hypothetical protein